MIPAYEVRLRNADYEKTVKELTAIAQASVNFFLSEGAWPVTISQLEPQFMPHAVTLSPFGTNYQMNCINEVVTVSVLIPTGIAEKNPQGSLWVKINQGDMDLIEISRAIPNELTSRLSYDAKHIY